MDHSVGKMRQVVQQLMPHCCGNGMPLCHRQLRTEGNIEFCMQPMSYPPDTYLCDFVHLWCVPDRVLDFCKYRGIYAVEQPRENPCARLPDNPHHGQGNHAPDYGIY